MDGSRREIEDRATELLLKREGNEWGPADEGELSQWLEASTANRVAFLRAEAAWEGMGRLKALGAGLPRRVVPTPDALEAIQLGTAGEEPPAKSAPASRRAMARRHRAAIGIAASILVASGLLLASYHQWFAGEHYATAVGATASLPLEDGSRITLNTDSKVRVVFSERQRHIDLSQGEAFFEVAHDGHRPFVVQAGNRRIIAVGTQFSVRREGDEVQVVVTEGRVRVDSGDVQSAEASQPDTVSTSPAPARVLLAAGGVARARKGDVVVKNHPLAEAEELIGWRSGDIYFRETRLADAVAEFNRYNARQIVIRDPSVATMQLTGKFRATNSDAFVSLLERTYGIEVERTDASILLGSPSVALRE
jgi:transmembrane sensor